MPTFNRDELWDKTSHLHISKLKVPTPGVPSTPAPSDPTVTPKAPIPGLPSANDPLHPLKRYSLRGSSEHLEKIAVAQVPLLSRLCFAGQLTVWYGPPNAGKTLLTLNLLIEAVEEGRVNPEDVIYVNVDDTTAGLAEKVGILEQRNVHVLGEGHNKFTAGKLVSQLQETIAQHKAYGVFLILDTMKKFASLMDKKESSTFNTLCRQFAAAGGTILALAHTNKRAGPNGELVHAGTSDVREDFDAAYILIPREDDSTSESRVVEFKNIKMRGGSDDRVLFSYDCTANIPYDQRLASVTRLDSSGFAPIVPPAEARRQELIEVIEARICTGPVQKIDLAKDVSATTGLGRHSVIKIIDELTGEDPAKHRWGFERGARGAKFYRLLDRESAEVAAEPNPAAS